MKKRNLKELMPKVLDWLDEEGYFLIHISDDFITYKKDFGNPARIKSLDDFEEENDDE
jgi:hypothetical protein